MGMCGTEEASPVFGRWTTTTINTTGSQVNRRRNKLVGFTGMGPSQCQEPASTLIQKPLSIYQKKKKKPRVRNRRLPIGQHQHQHQHQYQYRHLTFVLRLLLG